MTHENNLTQPFITPTLIKRMLIGGGIGLTFMVLFLSGANHPHPEWGEYWMIRPLVVITLAGATGAACYHKLDSWRQQFHWNKIVTIIAGLLIFIIGLWMGTVLGLAGTLWN